jgi:hypothetical protein
MDFRESFARADAVATLLQADDADRVIDRVLLRTASCAETQRGVPDADCADTSNVPILLGPRLVHGLRSRKSRLGWVAALGRDPALVGPKRRAVRQRLLRARTRLDLVDAEIRAGEQVACGRHDELGEVGGPLATERRERLPDLERVPYRVPQRLIHVRDQTHDLAFRAAPELEHGLRKRLGVGLRLHEGAVAYLDVEDDCVGAGGDLLGHDARGDQADVVDGRRHVAQRVELLVGRDELERLPDHGEAGLAHLRYELCGGELDAKSRDRLELVERPSGVPQPAPRHLREGNPAGGDDGADGERRLVTDAAGRVLVHHLAAELLAERKRLSAAHKRVGERERLAGRESAEVHGHAERGHLVVGHVAARVREHELRDLVGGELPAVALALDQLGRVDHSSARIDLPGIRRGAAFPPR